MPQLSLSLHTPSPASLTRLREGLAFYRAAVNARAVLAAALPSVEADTTLSRSALTYARVQVIDAGHSVSTLEEYLREALYEVETGQPGRLAWNVKPLETFKAVLARAQTYEEA